MKLEVIVGSDEELNEAISCDGLDFNIGAYRAYIKDILQEAAEAGEKSVSFRSVEMAEKPSDNFTRAGWIEQAVNEYQMQNGLPDTVRIVCPDSAAAEPYKVVYNFYYAVTKEERLDDEKWD